MTEDQPSATALRVALRRAAHQLLDRPPVFEDSLALRIIGAGEAARIQADPEEFDRGRVARHLRAFLAVRSRFAEDQLVEAVSGGVRQYVVLGAGLDTFAYRNPFPELRVFEVDRLSTQIWKRARLREEAIPVPESVTFVPVDFERQRLREELERAGLHAGQPAFFSWLGVTPYLSRDSAMETLRQIAATAGAGGGVVFDYGVEPRLLSPLQAMALRHIADWVSSLGEPMRTFFDPEELTGELRAMGFARVEDVDGRALNSRYLAGRADGMSVGGAARIIHAMR